MLSHKYVSGAIEKRVHSSYSTRAQRSLRDGCEVFDIKTMESCRLQRPDRQKRKLAYEEWRGLNPTPNILGTNN